MGETKVIEPVTRLEGHAKITVHLNDNNQVEDAKFHVTEFRGYETFVKGRPLWEMPDITSRICGICPVSHHLGSAKACDGLVGAEIPDAAKKLRRLMHMGQILQSHALSFFYLSSPDLILGHESDPKKRNIVGLLEKHPELAKRGVSLRSLGQTVIQSLGKKKVHPEFAIPGGVTKNLDREDGEKLLEKSKSAPDQIIETIDTLKKVYENLGEEMLNCAVQETGYMGLVTEEDGLEHYDGKLKLIDKKGKLLERFDPSEYASVINERSEDWSYLKFPYYKKLGVEEGRYRVGPLARLNISEKVGTKLAQEQFERFKELSEDKLEHRTLFYHYARLIEMLFCVEKIQELLNDEDVYNGLTNVPVKPKNTESVGVVEAPRGTLIHDYKADENGMIEDANLVIATTHNNFGMNDGIKMVAEKFVDGPEIPEGILNRIESVIRCYDPCLSCSTHAIGKMPINLQLVSSDGEVLDEARK